MQGVPVFFKKKPVLMKRCILISFAVLILAPVVHAQNNTPIAVTGFNHDLVANGTGWASGSTTTSFDHSYNNNVFYVEGFGSGQYGLPADGSIVSDANPENSYQLAGYDGPNSLLIIGTNSGSLHLRRPGRFTDISFLASSAQGVSQLSVILHYTDGTHDEVLTGVSLPDWFHDGPNIAIQGLGRVRRNNNVFDDRYPNPKIFEFLIPDVDPEKVLERITFDKITDGGSRAGIFAISGNRLPPPVPFSGSVIPLVLLLMLCWILSSFSRRTFPVVRA